MTDLLDYLRPVLSFPVRRSAFLVLGAALGYVVGYRSADAGEPSLYSRVQSLAGVTMSATITCAGNGPLTPSDRHGWTRSMARFDKLPHFPRVSRINHG